jgi:predicted PurR-regulated permease PerM
MADERRVINEGPNQADNRPGWLSRERALAISLLALTVVVVYLCYLLALPFLPALSWAMALGVVAHPLHVRVRDWIGWPNVAALASTALVTVVLVVPAIFVTERVARQATAVVQAMQDETLQDRWERAAQRHPRLAEQIQSWTQGYDFRSDLQRAAEAAVGSLPTVVRSSVWLATQLLVTVFTLFFFFRDARRALAALRTLLPFSQAEADDFLARLNDTIYATLYGRVVVAAIQGVLGGLMFWVLDLPAPALWGAVMAVLALVPFLGAFVIWAPAAVFLALEGNWLAAVVLTLWGSVVIGLSDNLLYPWLVGERLRLHTLLIFFAIVGGVVEFGASGVILGPVILAVAVALLDVWRRRTAHGGTVEEGIKPSAGLELPAA